MPLIAHSSQDGRTQLFKDHATAVSRLSSDFAAEFNAANEAGVIGLLHDVGKCSSAGQRRINGGTDRVEHAAAGAEMLADSWRNNPYGYLLAYCVAGHHAGLPMGCLKEAMEGLIETKLANGFGVPTPVDTESFSGKFNIRIPKSLHFRLSVEAEREGVSLNQYALYKLCN